MIYFSFTTAPSGEPEMSVLDAAEDAAALDEAAGRLRDQPGAVSSQVFDGDRFIGEVEAPSFGFVGVNAATALPAPAELGEQPAAEIASGTRH